MSIRNHAALYLGLPLVFLFSGCGGTGAGHSSTFSSGAVATETGQAYRASPEWPGRMLVTYEPADSAATNAGRDLLRSEQLLEDLASGVNDTLKLPYNIRLIGRPCGEANAFWSQANRSVTLCYELVDETQNLFNAIDDPEPVTSTINVMISVLFHEMGHMLIDIYHLPITGREEDAVDQLATFLILGPEGRVDPEAAHAIRDVAVKFAANAALRGEAIDEGTLADVHALDESRMYNELCWLYGADPIHNADLVDNRVLPEDRARGCVSEYKNIADSWGRLLEPYVK